MGHLHLVKQDERETIRNGIREGEFKLGVQGGIQGRIVLSVELHAKRLPTGRWCIVANLGDGTRMQSDELAENEVESVAVATFAKLKAWMASMSKNGQG